MSGDSQQLARYLDGEMTPVEAAAFEARLGQSPSLQQELAELRGVGAAVRLWSRQAEARAGGLLKPTLRRAKQQERARSRQTLASYVVAALALVILPWTRVQPDLTAPVGVLPAAPPTSAAIERVEATDRHARVFVVGRSSTPVLWLADDVSDDDAAAEQDPG